MEAVLKTIHLTDWKGHPKTYYEMELTFTYARHSYTYFSIEGESKRGFADRIAYEVGKMYDNHNFTYTEQ